MWKSYFDVRISIAIIFTIIILYPSLSPTLAHGQLQQVFPFADPTTATTTRTIIKNQTNVNNNNLQNEYTTSHTSSGYSKKAENADNYTNTIAKPSSSITPKVVILNFYDNDIGQFTNAKPILDKYGFRGTFFIVCMWASSSNPDRMSWQDITQLYREGHDIESHSTTHKVLNKLSSSALDYELGQSKQCLHDHLGINATVFSPPHGDGWNNATVINAIARYYDLSIGGFVTKPMFLHCYGWKQHQQQLHQQSPTQQTDCSTYSNDGRLNYANRYDIKENSHNSLDTQYSHDDNQIFEKFVQLVNSQTDFNKNGAINAIPVIGYHNIANDKAITSTDVNLFDREMKYLHDNGFQVLTMADLGYDENSKCLYVRNSM